MNAEEILAEAFRNRDVKILVQWFFNETPTPGQEEIVKSILYPDHKRICINAMTRYGKTYGVKWGVGLYIIFNTNKRIAIIAPTGSQAGILRTYLSDMIVECAVLNTLVDIDTKGIERLRREASRTRQTFKNGCEYRIFSAEGEAERLMGFGANGLVIVDEACLIPELAWAKISRMLGDNPEETKLIEISNPWNRSTQYYRDWTSGKFLQIHIGYEQAIEEGRTTREFVEEQRSRLTALEFQVLYKSEFPDQAEDSLFNYEKVLAATKQRFTFKEIENKIIAADIADKGVDSTVIMYAEHAQDYYIVKDIYSENKSENTAVAGRIISMHEKHSADLINIDTIGVGVGVVSMVKEGKKLSRTRVVGCHFGEGATDKKRFANAKAEMYFRLNDLINNGQIEIPNHSTLIAELLAIRWEHTSNGKIKILDPDKSPDFADCLVYVVWKQKKGTYAIA